MHWIVRLFGKSRAYKNADLLQAVRNGALAAAVASLNEGADVDARDEKDKGHTPLMLAAKDGNREMVEVLLERGADVNLQSTHGWAALMWAANEGHKDVISTILARRPDAIGEGGIVAVVASGFARDHGHSGIASLLLRARENRGSMQSLVDTFWKGWTEPEQSNITIWVDDPEADVTRKLQKDFPVYATALLVHEMPKQLDDRIRDLFQKKSFSVQTVSAKSNAGKGGTDVTYLVYFK